MNSIKLTRENIKKLLLGGTFAINSNVTPVLSWLKLTVKDNSLSVVSTNEQNRIKIEFPLSEPCENCDFCVDYFTLKDALKLITDDYVTLNVDTVGNNGCQLIYNGGSINFPIENSINYPVPIISDFDNVIKVDCSILRSILSKAIHFVNDDNLRPVICCVNFATYYDEQAKQSILKLTASDGIQMFYDSIKLDEPVLNNLNFNLNSKSITSILPLLNSSDIIEINLSSSHMFINIDNNCKLTCRLTDGVFPNVSSLIKKPTDFMVNAKINKNNLIMALKRLLLTCTSSFTAEIVGDGSSIKLSVNDIVSMKSGEEHIDCENSDGINCRINIKFLLNVLEAIDTQMVTIGYINEKSIIGFLEADNTNFPNQYICLCPCQ